MFDLDGVLVSVAIEVVVPLRPRRRLERGALTGLRRSRTGALLLQTERGPVRLDEHLVGLRQLLGELVFRLPSESYGEPTSTTAGRSPTSRMTTGATRSMTRSPRSDTCR